MRLRDLALAFDDDPKTPPYRRLMRAVEAAIREGRLKPGVALPGSRALAEALGMSRNTAVAALHRLEQEGWLVTEPNRGTFVADPPPEAAPAPPEPVRTEAQPNFDLPSRLSPLSSLDPEALVLTDGIPDARLFPAGELAKAYQRALQRREGQLLAAGEPMGNALLRDTLAAWLSERRALRVAPEQILVTRGSRQALALLSVALLQPGSVVGVEDPGNPQAWEALRQAPDVDLRPLPVDGEGLVVEALEALLARGPVRAVHLTPQRQFPTTVPLSPARRRRLLELAAAHRIVLIEEDHDAEYAYGRTPPPPLASQDDQGQVVHLSSLSRLMAPGLRLGFLVAPAALVRRLARLQRNLEWQGDPALEWAVADLIRDGALDRHLRRARKAYEARRDRLADLLAPFGDRLRAEVPTGGLAFWLEGVPGTDLEAWVRGARDRGLLLHPPSHFAFQGPGRGTRMGFAQLDEAQLEEAVRRLGRAL